MTTFGNHLRAAIKQAKINQRKLARAARKSEAQISHYCNDLVFPKRAATESLRRVLEPAGADMGWLKKFGLTEEQRLVCPKCGGTGKAD